MQINFNPEWLEQMLGPKLSPLAVRAAVFLLLVMGAFFALEKAGNVLVLYGYKLGKGEGAVGISEVTQSVIAGAFFLLMILAIIVYLVVMIKSLFETKQVAELRKRIEELETPKEQREDPYQQC